MQVDFLALVFLAYLFVLMPRAALRSARYLKVLKEEGKPRPSRTRILAGTLITLGVTFAMAWMNARTRQMSLFQVPPLGVREIGVSLLALGAMLATIPLSRAMRSPEERRNMTVLSLAPRNATEYAMFATTAIAAGIAEESAYRGVAIWILSPMVGLVAAWFLSAAAFAVSHAVQGRKSMGLVFLIALISQAQVYFTGTLVLAMIVHAGYDLIAGALAGRRALEYEREAATAPSITSS